MISDYLSTLITNSRVVDFKSGKRIKISIPTLHFDDGFVFSLKFNKERKKKRKETYRHRTKRRGNRDVI